MSDDLISRQAAKQAILNYGEIMFNPDKQIAAEALDKVPAVQKDIIFSRKWAMPNSATFSILPIKEFVERNIAGKEIILDPFAGGCKYGTVTNDLNPDVDTDYHLDALDFLKQFPDNYADCVLYDPPYSLRQVSECYKGVGREVTMETTQASWRARHLDEIARVLKVGGIALCFGWNSNGVGKKRGFEIQEILLVPHGGSKNDTICTFEIKRSDMEDK